MHVSIEELIVHGLNIVYAAAIFFIGKWVAKVLSDLTEKALSRTHIEAALVHFLKTLVYFSLFAFVVIAALGKLGIQTASFVAVLGAAGFAVGMALQGSLSNFAAGVMILIFKPFKIGDYVTAAGSSGIIMSIQIFNTIMHAPDDIEIIIPNAQVISGTVMNYVATGKRRVDLKVGIGYSDNIDKARTVIAGVLANEPRILAEPAAVIAVSELGESSVNFVVRPWVRSADYWDVYFVITENIKKAFDAQGISIPYKQMDIFIRNPEALTAKK